MRDHSLRTKITVLAVLIGGLGLLVFGTVMGVVLRKTKIEKIDSLLKEQSAAFFSILDTRKVPVTWQHDPSLRELFSVVHSLYSIEVEEPLGTIVYRTRKPVDRHLPQGNDGQIATVPLGDSYARIYQIQQNGVRLRIAADLEPMLATERTMQIAFGITLPTILVFIGLGARWLTRKALKPVDEISAMADAITASELGRRLPVSKMNDEIGRLTAILNRMMDRLERSFEQSRRFASDASHELKTPLTIIRGEVEAALGSGTLPPAAERTMANIQEETGRLVHIMEGLLLLSRADAGRLKLDLQPFNLSAFVNEMREDIEILALPGRITVEVTVDPGLIVRGDPRFLRQVLLNLFDNAIKYNVDGGRIIALLERRQARAYFRIGNSGPGIKGEARLRVFDRFYRAEPSRERALGGQGLGLSICAEIIRAHHGTISLIADSAPDWTAFEFHIPLGMTQT